MQLKSCWRKFRFANTLSLFIAFLFLSRRIAQLLGSELPEHPFCLLFTVVMTALSPELFYDPGPDLLDRCINHAYLT